MMATCEIYKGIEFVRISSFKEAEKNALWQTFDKSKIIKILKNDGLLSDCIQFHDYCEWASTCLSQELTVKQPIEKLTVEEPTENIEVTILSYA